MTKLTKAQQSMLSRIRRLELIPTEHRLSYWELEVSDRRVAAKLKALKLIEEKNIDNNVAFSTTPAGRAALAPADDYLVCPTCHTKHHGRKCPKCGYLWPAIPGDPDWTPTDYDVEMPREILGRDVLINDVVQSVAVGSRTATTMIVKSIHHEVGSDLDLIGIDENGKARTLKGGWESKLLLVSRPTALTASAPTSTFVGSPTIDFAQPTPPPPSDFAVIDAELAAAGYRRAEADEPGRYFLTSKGNVFATSTRFCSVAGCGHVAKVAAGGEFYCEKHAPEPPTLTQGRLYLVKYDLTDGDAKVNVDVPQIVISAGFIATAAFLEETGRQWYGDRFVNLYTFYDADDPDLTPEWPPNTPGWNKTGDHPSNVAATPSGTAKALPKLTRPQEAALLQIKHGTYQHGRGKQVLWDNLKHMKLVEWRDGERALTPTGEDAVSRKSAALSTNTGEATK